MLIVITEAVQDLQTVQHAPIVRVVRIVLQVVLVVCAVVAHLREKLTLSGVFKKKSSGGSRNLKSDYSKNNLNGTKNPVYYYDSNMTLAEDNFLYTINKKVEVRKAPGDRFKVLETLQPNSKLIFLNKEEKWYKIRVYKSGTEGFVHSKM